MVWLVVVYTFFDGGIDHAGGSMDAVDGFWSFDGGVASFDGDIASDEFWGVGENIFVVPRDGRVQGV
jgi:hypothetical protein